MDTDGSQLIYACVICAALIAIRAFFTCCETACVEANDSRIKAYENEKGSKGLLFRLMSKPYMLMSAFSAHRILNAVMITLAANVCFADAVSENVEGYAEVLAWVGIIFAVLLLPESLGDSLPKRLIRNRDVDKLAVALAPATRILCILMRPVTLVSEGIAGGIAALFGVKGDSGEDTVTEEEILMMIDAGNETGSIESSEREMINNVFEFHDMTVSDVMTHRTDVVAVSQEAEVSEAVVAAINSGFSRIPVYKDSIDHIIGIIYVKDLLCLIGTQSTEGISVKNFLRDAEFVPESCMCGELFKKLTAGKLQFAVAVDEYGGTAGIVTMEDLVEAIVGNIQDEYDNEAEELTRISDNTYTISGTADAADIMETLGSPLPEDSEFDTMSGLVIDLLGYIPEEDDTPSVVYKNITFTVLLTEDMRIVRIKAVINKDEEKELLNDEDKKEQN